MSLAFILHFSRQHLWPLLRPQTNVWFQQGDHAVNRLSQDVCLGEALRFLQDRTAGTALAEWGTGLAGPTVGSQGPSRPGGPSVA